MCSMVLTRMNSGPFRFIRNTQCLQKNLTRMRKLILIANQSSAKLWPARNQSSAKLWPARRAHKGNGGNTNRLRPHNICLEPRICVGLVGSGQHHCVAIANMKTNKTELVTYHIWICQTETQYRKANLLALCKFSFSSSTSITLRPRAILPWPTTSKKTTHWLHLHDADSLRLLVRKGKGLPTEWAHWSVYVKYGKSALTRAPPSNTLRPKALKPPKSPLQAHKTLLAVHKNPNE